MSPSYQQNTRRMSSHVQVYCYFTSYWLAFFLGHQSDTTIIATNSSLGYAKSLSNPRGHPSSPRFGEKFRHSACLVDFLGVVSPVLLVSMASQIPECDFLGIHVICIHKRLRGASLSSYYNKHRWLSRDSMRNHGARDRKGRENEDSVTSGW